MLISVKQVERDYITVSTTAEPLELDVTVEFASDDSRIWPRLLDDAPARVDVMIDPPEVVLHKPVDELTYEDIRELIRASVEQADQRSPEEQVNALAWLESTNTGDGIERFLDRHAFQLKGDGSLHTIAHD